MEYRITWSFGEAIRYDFRSTPEDALQLATQLLKSPQITFVTVEPMV